LLAALLVCERAAKVGSTTQRVAQKLVVAHRRV